jgi:hypothetical protein
LIELPKPSLHIIENAWKQAVQELSERDMGSVLSQSSVDFNNVEKSGAGASGFLVDANKKGANPALISLRAIDAVLRTIVAIQTGKCRLVLMLTTFALRWVQNVHRIKLSLLWSRDFSIEAFLA